MVGKKAMAKCPVPFVVTVTCKMRFIESFEVPVQTSHHISLCNTTILAKLSKKREKALHEPRTDRSFAIVVRSCLRPESRRFYVVILVVVGGNGRTHVDYLIGKQRTLFQFIRCASVV